MVESKSHILKQVQKSWSKIEWKIYSTIHTILLLFIHFFIILYYQNATKTNDKSLEKLQILNMKASSSKSTILESANNLFKNYSICQRTTRLWQKSNAMTMIKKQVFFKSQHFCSSRHLCTFLKTNCVFLAHNSDTIWYFVDQVLLLPTNKRMKT